MCSVIIESESRLEGRVKIVYLSGCGDADHSDGWMAQRAGEQKEWTLHLRLTVERGEKTEKGECEASFNYLPDVFREEEAGRGYRFGVSLNGLNILLWTIEHDSESY